MLLLSRMKMLNNISHLDIFLLSLDIYIQISFAYNKNNYPTEVCDEEF